MRMISRRSAGPFEVGRLISPRLRRQAFVYAVRRPSTGGRQASLRSRAAFPERPSPLTAEPSLPIALIIERLLTSQESMGHWQAWRAMGATGLHMEHSPSS
jgi:hypothetical protein